MYVALYWAIDSSLHIDVDMVSYFELAQEIGPLLSIKTYPAIDQQAEILSTHELLL